MSLTGYNNKNRTGINVPVKCILGCCTLRFDLFDMLDHKHQKRSARILHHLHISGGDVQYHSSKTQTKVQTIPPLLRSQQAEHRRAKSR